MLITLCRHYSILIWEEQQNPSHKTSHLSVCSRGAPDLWGKSHHRWFARQTGQVCDRSKCVAKSSQFACWHSGLGRRPRSETEGTRRGQPALLKWIQRCEFVPAQFGFVLILPPELDQAILNFHGHDAVISSAHLKGIFTKTDLFRFIEC